MRILAAAIVASLAVGVGPAALALDAEIPPASTPSTRQTGPGIAVNPLSREERLDALFQTLSTAKDANAIQETEREIVGIWLESGSDTVDLLMRWALEAIDGKEYPLALDYLDRITTLEPKYVEGWNKRATVYFLIDDYGKAIADIERVLALEPRHFGALSGLGTILRDLGEDGRALNAYRAALSYDPHMDNVRKAIDDLEAKGTDGRDI